ncbi:MAG: hypothetical protein Fur0046_37150 [Cyanobacteria bacterium J069]
MLIEGKVQSLLQNHPALSNLKRYTADILLFSPAHHVLVLNYLKNYFDLEFFYSEKQIFLPAIAAHLARVIADFHSTTLGYGPIYELLHPEDPTLENWEPSIAAVLSDATPEGEMATVVPQFEDGLEWLTPEDLGRISEDGLRFFELYFRSADLHEAIAQLSQTYAPCCLTHQDLKFGNVLLHQDWRQRIAQPESLHLKPLLRLIDWEKAEWGDPAMDMGCLIASYLRLWLRSLVVSGLDLALALRLADVPLEQLQPSLRALVRGYAAQFPEMGRSPEFWIKTMQFAGYSLIRTLRVKALHFEPLGNVGLCMMQVATSLLCRPEAAIASVFGMSAEALLQALGEPPEEPAGRSPAAKFPDSAPDGHAQEPASTLHLAADAGLTDLVHNLQISAQGRIFHGACPAAALIEDDRPFDQLPPALQQSYLRLQLRNVIYDLYFTGAHLTHQPTAADLRNTTQRGIDVEFFERLSVANPGGGFFEDGWQVTQLNDAAHLQAEQDGLRLRIERDRHLQPAQRNATVGDVVAVRLPPYRMDASFYTVLGDCGPILPEEPALQIYFNLSPAGAIALMQALIPVLNGASRPFALSLLHDPADYGRRDGGMLRIRQTDWATLAPLLQSVYATVRSHLQPAIPLFTKLLAPGLGLAEEPVDGAIEFGLHRAQLVADALLECSDPAERLAAVRRQFELAGLAFEQPYLNAGAGDRYAFTPDQIPVNLSPSHS